MRLHALSRLPVCLYFEFQPPSRSRLLFRSGFSGLLLKSSLHRLLRQSLPKVCEMNVRGGSSAHCSAHIFSQLFHTRKTNKRPGQHYATRTLLISIPKSTHATSYRTAWIVISCSGLFNISGLSPFADCFSGGITSQDGIDQQTWGEGFERLSCFLCN